MLPHRVCCVPTQFPSEPRCTGVQRRPLCTDCCWYRVCWTGVQMVVIAGQPGKQTVLHDDPHTEEKHTRTHTYTRTPIKALARENLTCQLVGTEEWRLTCLHCDNEATHRRAFLQARAALAGSELQQCYNPPAPSIHTCAAGDLWMNCDRSGSQRGIIWESPLSHTDFPLIVPRWKVSLS